jgi:DNA polymerase V
VQARWVRFYLKTQDFTYTGLTLDLGVPLADPREFLRAIEARFDDVYEPFTLYRATGIGLYALTQEDAVTPDLFGTSSRIEKGAPLLKAIDTLNHKYGRHTVHLAESLGAVSERDEPRSTSYTREIFELPVHQRKKTISIPHLGVVH